MDIEIKALTPDLEEAYFDFFDHRAFSDGSPYYPCYCNAFNMRAEEIENMRKQTVSYGTGTEGWKRTLRETASRMLKEGNIKGYLAFDKDIAIGWCNANDKMNYYRIGEFDLDFVSEERNPADCERNGLIKSVVCFEISPEYRGKGIATQLLKRVCTDAQNQGYSFVEGYSTDKTETVSAFTGPVHLYKKMGFTEYSQVGSAEIMRKGVLF
ncbi:MAG: GNAT family N-acetyltransferase [Solobacterium sp.]|nr:GNAT family N-acetyltransferase [Solobacterium sp.]